MFPTHNTPMKFKSYQNRARKEPVHLTAVNISKIPHFSFTLLKLVSQVMERFTSLLNEVIHLLKYDMSDLRVERAGKKGNKLNFSPILEMIFQICT